MSHRPRRALDDRGAVAAEFAVALPAIIVVVALGVGALGLGARQVRLQDATADAARLIARGDDAARAAAVVAAVGGAARFESRGDFVCVVAEAPAPMPFLPPPSASSCALAGGL
ncbi:TadE family type IV pilus minor pilin [Microbacterium sp. NPDC091313]